VHLADSAKIEDYSNK